MKVIFMLVFIAMMVSISFAQFKVSSNGVVTKNGEVVFVANIEGITAKQLYDGVNAWVMSNFKKPDAVSSKEDGKMLKIHGMIAGIVNIHKIRLKAIGDMAFYFKGGVF